MKLEAEKYYKTRDGRKAYVAANMKDGNFPFLVTYLTENEEWDYPEYVMENGSCFRDSVSDCDLIAEWTEPEAKAEDVQSPLTPVGVALRDYFAANALQGMLSRDAYQGGWSPKKNQKDCGVKKVAKFAYEYADAMLSARGIKLEPME